MKLKRVAAALTAGALSLSLGASALAADAADERLVKVTQAVKATLNVGDEYTEFYGEPSETYLGTKWDLSWSGEDKRLNVSATEEGKVLSMNRSVTSSGWREQDFGPSFPAMTQAEARTKAEEFLDRVLTQGETAVFDDSRESSAGLSVEQYGFGGTIYLNGLKTPMSFRIWVNVKQGDVSSFWRDDESGYAGAVPAPTTVTTDAKARALLRDTLDLELIYVRDSKDGKAVLRYVPRSTDDFYVDAATGKLVNLTELQRELYKNAAEGGMDAAPEMAVNTSMAADRSGLTAAELEGVAKLEGVKDKTELDKLARAWKELKLDGFELSGCSYSVEREDGGITVRPVTVNVKAGPAAEGADETAPADTKVTACLTYNKKAGDAIARRSVTLDAKTGELLYMSGYDPYDEGKVKTTPKAAEKIAGDFLRKLWGGQFAKCELYSSTEAETASGVHRFVYAQKENGYFFPANEIVVRVSAGTGAVMGFTKSFDDDVEFDSAEGLIDLETAKTAWVDSFPVELAYLAVPVKLDLMGPEVRPLINAGYSYFNALKPGYELGQQEVYSRGVDAKTGELVTEPAAEPEKMTYDDLDGHWAKAALEELALYNVGWMGGKADPDGALTQLGYIALLASSDGYTADLSQEGAADSLYDYAVRRGLLTKDQRDDDKVLTRGEMVELLLDSLGYKAVANLSGIFRCDFTDAGDIPASGLGYAALAQGLGIISGDSQGRYAASRPAQRAEAAVMLWKYMKR